MGRITVFVLVALAGLAACSSPPPEKTVQTWTNPISLPDEWEDYGLGDPYVFFFNGYYYLYVSTRDTDAGVKVWSSPDLVNWTYRGLCTEEPLTAAAYAPEVRYWNGKFYMYTSPAGQGHYVLESVSPVGPFSIVTDNFGMSIDGTTFVDDDGQWYFYYAGPMGIQAAKMDSPISVDRDTVTTEAYMGGWTEGPTVFKRNGRYYMTYTGNHVFSEGYRIDAATSESPLGGFITFADNPVLIRTEGKTVGLGHNSVVIGPDLDSQFMIYHNLEGPGVVGPLRHMDMDRMVWNGERFTVWGPTSEPQPAPELPAFADRFERDSIGDAWWGKEKNGAWSILSGQGLAVRPDFGVVSKRLTKAKSEASFTAAFNVRLAEGTIGLSEGKAGAVFSYQDESNYATAWLMPDSNRLVVDIYEKGKRTMAGQADLPPGFDLTQWHQLRIEKAAGDLRVYVDEMLKVTAKTSLAGGRVGYAAEKSDAVFGYIAFSNKVNGSSAYAAYQPLPGTIQGAGFEEGALRNTDAVKKENDAADSLEKARVGTALDSSGRFWVADLQKKEWLSYLVRPEYSGTYSLSFRIIPGDKGVKFRVTQDGSIMASIQASPGMKPDTWQTVTVSGLSLNAGSERWKLEVEEGSMNLDTIQVSPYTEVTATEDTFDDGNDFGWTRYEGVWSVKEKQLRASSATPAKSVIGETGWTDYTVSADIMRVAGEGQAGVLLRVTDAADGTKINQNRADFMKGYEAYADAEGIHLAKFNYGSEVVASVPYPVDSMAKEQWLRLTVKARGTQLDVYLNDSADSVIHYVDDSGSPFLHGKAGLRAVDGAARFDHFEIRP